MSKVTDSALPYTFPAHYITDDDIDIYPEYFRATGEELIRLREEEIQPTSWIGIQALHMDHVLSDSYKSFGIQQPIGLLPTKARSRDDLKFPRVIRTDERWLIELPESIVTFLAAIFFNLAHTDEFCALVGLTPPPVRPDGKILTFHGDAALLEAVEGEDGTLRMHAIHTAVQCAVTLLVDHEFAHIKNGHFIFLNSERGRASTLRERRALEFDADAFACNMSFAQVQASVAHFQEIRADTGPRPEDRPWSSFDEALQFTAAVQYVIFRAFATSDTGLNFWLSPHPPPMLRAIVCARHIEANLRTIGIDEPPEVAAARIVRVIQAIEPGLNRFGWRSPGPVGQVAFEIYQAYLFEIGRGWNSIRDDLDQLKLGGKIAPAHAAPRLDRSPFREIYQAAQALPGWPAPD